MCNDGRTGGRDVLLLESVSCLRTTSESISGNHRGHGNAEATCVRERTRVVTCDALMIECVIDHGVACVVKTVEVQGQLRLVRRSVPKLLSPTKIVFPDFRFEYYKYPLAASLY